MDAIQFTTPGGQSFTVNAPDDKADDVQEAVEGLVEASVEEQTSGLESDLEEAQEEADTLRELAIDEIIRHKKIDGAISGEREVEKERSYLENSSAERLKSEHERAVGTEKSTEASVEHGGTNDEEEQDKYAELGL